MKNVLLVAINAKYVHSNLAVHSLKASAGTYQQNVTVAEYTINQQKDQILRDVFQKKPDLLCFSCYLWNLSYMEDVAREFHKLLPKVPIWVGGPEVSYETEGFLQGRPYVKGVMIGEGEDTFRELCACYLERDEEALGINAKAPAIDAKAEAIDAKAPAIDAKAEAERGGARDMDGILATVPGLCFRTDEGEITWTKPREPKNLSEVPFCYENLGEYENRIIYYESSRGCPFSCSYCLSSIDKKLRFRELELVKKELAFFLEQRIPQVKFVDRTFNCDHVRTMAIWEFLKDHDNGVTNFHFEISADLLREEELRLISEMRPGLIQLEIGVQTTNEHTIREIRRTMDLGRLKENVRRIREYGNVHQHLDLIAGLPYEDYESFRHSFDEIHALWPNQLQLGFLKVLKGSFMYERAKDYGLIWHEQPPYEVLRTDWLTYEEILKIKNVEEMLEVYYNSGQFEVTMKLLDCIRESMFDLYLELGEFYERNGYAGLQHSRLRRSEILLEFLSGEPEIGLFREALTFDLYYRENCKTRPSWAPDLSDQKELTRQLCPKGKTSHLEPFHYHFPGKLETGLKELPQKSEKCIYALFHYEERDPLDHQAKVEWIDTD